MKDFVKIQSNWFVRSNEFLLEYLKTGGDAFVTDIRFLQVKQEVYVAILGAFNRLILQADQKGNLHTNSGSEFRNVMADLKLDLRESYDKMVGLNPDSNRGFAETMSEALVREVHKSLPLPRAKFNPVRSRMIAFWNSFFRLPLSAGGSNSGSGLSSHPLDSLVASLEEDLANILANAE